MKNNKAVLEMMVQKQEDETISSMMRKILAKIGEDPDREGLVRTPDRAEKALRYITSGYQMDIDKIVNGALFTHACDEMIVVKDIEFFSMCEHHLLPFMGKAHVGYLPRGKVTGLSKLARVVEEISHRPQVQERMTHQIADLINADLDPKGVIVILEAEHTCMTIRGIRKPGSLTVTSAVRGLFKSNPASRAEAMALIHGAAK